MTTDTPEQLLDTPQARELVQLAIHPFTAGRDMGSVTNTQKLVTATHRVAERLDELYPDAGESLGQACLDFERAIEECDGGAVERSELLRDFALRCMRTGLKSRDLVARPLGDGVNPSLTLQPGAVTYLDDDTPHHQRVAESTMLGDLMRVLVAQLKQLDKPWGELREYRQRAMLDAFEKTVESAITTACRHIAARDVDAVLTTLEKVTTQGGKVVAQLSVPPRTEGLHDLVDAAVETAEVLVVLPADIENWNRGELPRATPDQLDLEDEANRKAAEEDAPADEEGLDDSDATGPGSAPIDLEAGDIVLVGANQTRGTVLEVHGDEAIVETDLGGTVHATRFPITALKRPGGDA